MPSISLCMIAKDEEEWIAQAINSVKSIVSEIILVDTGSTDKTMEIAASLGAKVFEQPWVNDFGATRNFSLEKATGDWILVLDADEAIAESDLAEVVRMTNDPSLCWLFPQRHYTDDQRLSNFTPVTGECPEWEKGHGGYFESSLVRLFPNHAGIEYRGKVHELVEHSIRDLGKHQILPTKVRIHHYGHIRPVKQKKHKGKLYTPLGEAKIGDKPRDWKAWNELGVEHNNNGNLVESEKAFIESAALNPFYTDTWYNLGYVQCELGKHEAAIASMKKSLELDPRCAEAYCNLAVVFMRVRKYPLAEEHLRRAIALNKTYINAYCNLGTTLAMMNRFAEAANVYQRVLDMFPNCVTAQTCLGELYLQSKLYDLAEKHLTAAAKADPGNSRPYFNLNILYQALNKNAEAVDALEHYCAIEEESLERNSSPEQKARLERLRKEQEKLRTRSVAVSTSESPQTQASAPTSGAPD
jgi:tetratricopeptide (TPR) repeat protein